MALIDILRAGVATVDKVTKSVQPTVRHAAWREEDQDGEGYAGAPSFVERKAVVERNERIIRTTSGQLVASKHKITFVGPVTVDTRDTIVLPSGQTGPLLAVETFPDAGKGGALITEVWQG